MVHGAISQYGDRAYTDMAEVFAALGNIQENYNWLISNFELNQEVEELYGQDSPYCWFTGQELAELLAKYPSLQWIWGFFRGFDKSISREEVMSHSQAFEAEFEGFWTNPVSIQHPLADIEIVPWDSTLVLLVGKDEKLVEQFKQNFEPCVDLAQYNDSLFMS